MTMESTRPNVGYQGVPGAHSEEALLSFLPGAIPIPLRTLDDLFAALDSGVVDLAFVPVENSHAGSVAEAYDLMLDYQITVEAEWIHPVNHYLLGVDGSVPSEIERVFSHPQALAQSSAFLRQASLESEPYYDTAGAAQMVAERQDRRYAAVASRLAGERYGLTVLAEGIQTAADNATRFFLIARGAWAPDRTPADPGAGKTSLVFAVEHKPGALVRALSCFARERVNLARLESRPSRERPWEYLFYVDVEGYTHEPHLRTALRELKRLNPFVRVLGSYPAAVRTNNIYAGDGASGQ
ncbi:MAG TPA: prephenate dehydratase [Chloroflexota bacterium]